MAQNNSNKQVFSSTRLPAPKGPYSQAIRAGDFLFISGMLGIDPASGQAPDNVAGQAKQILENLRILLEDAGASMADIVKTTVFLRDIADFAAMNEVYATYFQAEPPARSTIQAAPPGGYLVEMEAVAVLSDNK
jgi:2-iminobutanoate/2-iminopropanoate deaminase